VEGSETLCCAVHVAQPEFSRTDGAPPQDPLRDDTPGTWTVPGQTAQSGSRKAFLRERAKLCYLRTKDAHSHWSTVLSEAQLIATERACPDDNGCPTYGAVDKLITKAESDHHDRDTKNVLLQEDRLRQGDEANRTSKAELIIGKA